MDTAKITSLLARFMELGISEQLDYEKFNLYSIITNSTAIEGSTITEVENHLMFEDGLAPAGRTIVEQMMNLDLKEAYEQAMHNAHTHREITKDSLCELSALVLKNTGSKHSTMQGEFDSSKGELRLVNVSAGAAGRSYMDFKKVPQRLAEFCEWLNTERKNLKTSDIFGAYRL
ncbi:MAG: Fic family protein, partial [Muribaculaceae bacterium]|nr:Fic family protein [Muribaculaceae bacterium]